MLLGLSIPFLTVAAGLAIFICAVTGGGILVIMRLRRQLSLALRENATRQLDTHQRIAEVLGRMEQRLNAHEAYISTLQSSQARIHDTLSALVLRVENVKEDGTLKTVH